MMVPTNITQLTIFSGNSGNAGTAQQKQGLQRSRYRNESGNKGTQLCLINRLISLPVPAEKTPGTSSHSVARILERLYPRSRVPAVFEFRRCNSGGYVLFLLTRRAHSFHAFASCSMTRRPTPSNWKPTRAGKTSTSRTACCAETPFTNCPCRRSDKGSNRRKTHEHQCRNRAATSIPSPYGREASSLAPGVPGNTAAIL